MAFKLEVAYSFNVYKQKIEVKLKGVFCWGAFPMSEPLFLKSSLTLLQPAKCVFSNKQILTFICVPMAKKVERFYLWIFKSTECTSFEFETLKKLNSNLLLITGRYDVKLHYNASVIRGKNSSF